MPARKRLLILAAIGVALATVIAAVSALLHDHVVVGATVLLVTFAVVGSILQLYWVRFDLPALLRGVNSFWRGSRDRRDVALTFDDGPGPDTPAVLDALDACSVRATFFVIGRAAQERPELVREIERRGHIVASHGYSHRKLHLARPATIAQELDACVEAIRAADVEPSRLFRAPHGYKGPFLARALRQRGLVLVGWTRGVWDTERPGVSAIVERACRRMSGGEILLLHDGNGSVDMARDGREQTAAAIPQIVRRWRAAGFEFVTIDELCGVSAVRTPLAEAQKVLLRSRRGPPEDEIRGRTEEVSSGIPRIGSRVPLRRVLRWAGLVVLAGFCVGAFRRVDVHEVGRAVAAAKAPFLFAAACADVLALACQSSRWHAVVHPVEPRARSRDAFFALVAGYAIGLVIPARASDLARAHLMARLTGASTATLTTTTVVDHLLGSVTLFGALGLFAAMSPIPGFIRSAGLIACAGAIAVFITLWLLRPTPSRPFAEERAPGPPSQGSRSHMPGTALGGLFGRLRYGLLAVGRPRALALSLVFAVLGWTSEVLIAHLSLRAFNLPAGIGPSMMVVLATTISAAASVSPGNAGAFELACVIALSGFDVAREPALAFAIGYHAVHLVPTAAIGGGWLLAHGYRLAFLREAPR